MQFLEHGAADPLNGLVLGLHLAKGRQPQLIAPHKETPSQYIQSPGLSPPKDYYRAISLPRPVGFAEAQPKSAALELSSSHASKTATRLSGLTNLLTWTNARYFASQVLTWGAYAVSLVRHSTFENRVRNPVVRTLTNLFREKEYFPCNLFGWTASILGNSCLAGLGILVAIAKEKEVGPQLTTLSFVGGSLVIVYTGLRNRPSKFQSLTPGSLKSIPAAWAAGLREDWKHVKPVDKASICVGVGSLGLLFVSLVATAINFVKPIGIDPFVCAQAGLLCNIGSRLAGTMLAFQDFVRARIPGSRGDGIGFPSIKASLLWTAASYLNVWNVTHSPNPITWFSNFRWEYVPHATYLVQNTFLISTGLFCLAAYRRNLAHNMHRHADRGSREVQGERDDRGVK